MGNDQVIDLDQYKAARDQRAAVSTPDHATKAKALGNAGNLHQDLAIIQIWLLITADRLEAIRQDIQRSTDFCRACQDAWELTDIEAMEHARDKLVAELRDRPKAGVFTQFST